MTVPGDERRRGRRVDLQVPILLRSTTPGTAETFVSQVTKNISLAGVYLEASSSPRIHDVYVASISIPEAQRREFPFTRLAGRSRVVRVDALRDAGPGGQQRYGVALEFGGDVTALTTTPPRG